MPTKEATAGKVYLTYVDQWLDTLPAAESEDFKEFAEVTPSIIEIWVYAGILHYPGSFNDLSRWVKMKYKKLNRREILNSEIAALHSDIQELRMAITSGEVRADNGCQPADRVMLEITVIFKDDPQFAEPIENSMNAVWAKIYSELSNA